MKKAGNHNSIPVSWKQFLRFGEKILKKATSHAQCVLLEQTIQEDLNLETTVSLLDPFYPLPGEPVTQVEILSPVIASKLLDFKHQNEWFPILAQQTKKTVELYFPIKTEEHVLGIVRIHKISGVSIETRSIEFLEGILSHAALAMQIKRQETIKRWHSEQLALVRKVSSQIKDVSDVHEMCEQIAQTIQKTFKYYYAAIFLLNERDSLLQLNGSSKVENPEHLVKTIRIGSGIIGHSAQSGEEIIAKDVSKEPLFHSHELLSETRSEIAIPIKMGSRILGVLDIQSEKLDSFKQLDVSVLTSLADNIAIALTNASLFTDIKKRVDQINAALDVGHVLNSILDPDALLDEVVRLIHDRFGYLFVHLFIYQPTTRQIVFRTGLGPKNMTFADAQVVFDLDDPSGIIPLVARNKKTLLVNDVSKEPLYRSGYSALVATRSELTVPLLFGKELLGILDVQSDQLNAFDKDDRVLIESLATSIAITIRNANLYRSEQWRRKVSDSFQDVARMLTEEMNVDKLLDVILSKLESNLQNEASAIWLVRRNSVEYDDQSSGLYLGAAHGVSLEELEELHRTDNKIHEYLDQQLKSNSPRIRFPGEDFEPLGLINHFPENYSALIAPMKAGNQVLGLVTIAHPSPGKYGAEASAITATFASYAALALQNASNLANAQVQAWSSTILLQVVEAIQELTSLDELFSTMARLAPLLFGITKCGFFLWEEDRKSFILKADHNIPHDIEIRVKLEESLAFQAIFIDKSIQVVEDPQTELKCPGICDFKGSSKVILIPLLVHNEVIGAFLVSYEAIFQTGIELPFTDQTLSILQGIANQTSIAAENIQLSEMRQEEAYVTAVLLQVAQAVVSLNSLDEIIETIINLLPILVGIDCCVIYRWSETDSVYKPLNGFFDNKEDEEIYLQKPYAIGKFLLLDWVRENDTGKTCILTEQQIIPLEWPSISCSDENHEDQPSVNLLMGFPISYRGTVYGVLVTRELKAKMQFHEKRMEIITGVCQQLALAVQNEQFQRQTLEREKLQKEVQLAREIQKTFLPNKLPHVPGWEVDFRWQTAREVGGDLYDVFMVHPHTMALVIADVSDKGMPAALYMTVTRTLIRAFSKRFDSPARVLQQVNNELLKDEANSLFVTAVFALVDTMTGNVTYCNAGHNPPILFKRSTQLITPLQRTGMAIGVIREDELFDRTIGLDAGDMLMLYTDGVTESFSPTGEMFGEERVVLSLQMNQFKSVCDLLTALTDQVSEFRGSLQAEDDLTILAVQRLRR